MFWLRLLLYTSQPMLIVACPFLIACDFTTVQPCPTLKAQPWLDARNTLPVSSSLLLPLSVAKAPGQSDIRILSKYSLHQHAQVVTNVASLQTWGTHAPMKKGWQAESPEKILKSICIVKGALKKKQSTSFQKLGRCKKKNTKFTLLFFFTAPLFGVFFYSAPRKFILLKKFIREFTLLSGFFFFFTARNRHWVFFYNAPFIYIVFMFFVSFNIFLFKFFLNNSWKTIYVGRIVLCFQTMIRPTWDPIKTQNRPGLDLV